MRHLARTFMRQLGALLFVALTLVPVAASGHFHSAADHHTPDACAGCVITHHAPAASCAVLPIIAPVDAASTIVADVPSAPAHVWRPFHSGRAPPVLFATRTA